MTNTSVNSAANQHRNIENAARAKNPFESITDVLSYKSSTAEFSLYGRTKNDMDGKTLKWAFKLAERNVSPFYKELSMGWQPKVKQSDLNKAWARYLVAVDANKTPVAYSMFRFDLDYGHSVLYCYEMQIEPTAQRQGLGKHMMLALERCAKHWKMEKIVLTVLKNNENAQAFFKAIGYSFDDSTPDILEKADYEILSKSINLT
ncbi:N-alpha-acetyltransferase 40 [Calliphora vicina]|uniref:N-alpha-acetyltransferase 40 n=1 Tax=Calliphora vicina TaxID=7373 RepID=UPI00325B3272